MWSDGLKYQNAPTGWHHPVEWSWAFTKYTGRVYGWPGAKQQSWEKSLQSAQAFPKDKAVAANSQSRTTELGETLQATFVFHQVRGAKWEEPIMIFLRYSKLWPSTRHWISKYQGQDSKEENHLPVESQDKTGVQR